MKKYKEKGYTVPFYFPLVTALFCSTMILNFIDSEYQIITSIVIIWIPPATFYTIYLIKSLFSKNNS